MSAEVSRQAVVLACQEVGVDSVDLLRRADRIVLMAEHREVQEQIAKLNARSPLPFGEILGLESRRSIIDAKLGALR